MSRFRIIPVLLADNGRLVKTVRFKGSRYVGDPINAIRIFNEKDVDELVLLDITATEQKRRPDLRQIAEVASECFMPLCYGGGITSLEEIHDILFAGVEKVALNAAAHSNPGLIADAAKRFGSQSIVVSIDVTRRLDGGYEVRTRRGRERTGLSPADFSRRMEDLGAGEILLNSIDQDGACRGYDTELIRITADAVGIPVIACGGAGQSSDLLDAIGSGASAAAAGSMFVFYGRLKAVLINFPSKDELERLFESAPRGSGEK